MLENLPWYSYVIFAIAAASYAYRYFKIGKEEYDAPDLVKAKFNRSPNSQLNDEQLFAVAFYTPISEWWKADSNTLSFLTAKEVQPYLEGWGIDTPEGYWGLTEYFMKDGRRWYFDFIFHMIQNEPKENWDQLMEGKFGQNERAERYLKHLSTGETLSVLKQKGILTFDSEMQLGVAGYDAAILTGQARKAFTAKLISEEEAWKVISFARKLALETFSSWEEFGKSFALGFALDMREDYHTYKEEVFHLYKQVLEDDNSPWNTIDWPAR
ncbi:DUF1266 domain-containing protein [Reichenbachiella ulvae]|uniref:DUF1266 domain-containing protein n=1 Tax=Reichenbachiella ulvae TaxID=2980104 RepID=A0ABT3CUZ1_9BACT|nr:DUF1266 domain-containing protein [Reichenbachiella ulvae]MCV9387391.1 DUF1266 domain-containing protein [Reichenbachiella ulvae]